MKKLLTLLAFVMITGLLAAQPAHYITFNGTDQYMRIPHHSDFNIAPDQSFTLTGWVRNEYDGTVSMELQGTRAQIEQVILTLENSNYIRISQIDRKSIPTDPKEKRFRVRY